MKSREEVISVTKDICEKNKDINLGLGEIGSASWDHQENKLNETQLKDIGRVSALSLVFDIKPGELK